ncbi:MULTISPECIES: S41 family peptidase [Asticcacaulis]|uniref:S41 family peptidase n=1 Tax=Asticcacaulis TaxID=76890 RepID=UPI001AE1FE4B|nr:MULTISPECIES: S41 family peptidase [Asticcacaulis]MBP2157763.1 C-terminal processing protease CtpA/Prc [Asticcacaulis solisilvae]MDR6798808.1 C-terminal processing protease CtpA/Prc [Asticcacaulis sp. BE141]
MSKFSIGKVAHLCIAIAATAVIASCGGGGGGGGSSAPSGGGSSASSSSSSSSTTGWVSGVFQAASTFKDKCQAPRTGFDIEGTAFPDKAGTTLDEKNWLRSWTHETYLWNTEVIDTNPNNSSTRVQYFDTLKTLLKTSSGRDKDEFHFSEPTAEYLARRNSSASASYGAEIAILSGTVPRDVRVVFTDPGTPADGKLLRGTRILTVNGIDVVNGGTTQAEIDTLNNTLFPSTAGVTANLVVRDPGASANRSVTLVSANLVSKPVNRTRVLTDGAGRKTGYILFNTFSPYSSENDIVTAMQSMKDQGVADLVLDLRYNGGGLLAVASQLSYMVAGDAKTTGKTFERLRFNTAAGTLNPVTGAVNNPTPFYKTGLGFTVANGTALPALNLPRVFVLTTGNTCSASEAVINGLRGVGVEVILVGGKTCGKPYGFYPQDNCGETYYTIQFQGVNEVGFGDYADGFTAANSTETYGVKIAGCAVADDFGHELGDANEGLLKAAMTFGANGTCPAATITAVGSSSAASTSSGTSLKLERPEPWIMTTNRDMTMRR